jgi:hypothetical protein
VGQPRATLGPPEAVNPAGKPGRRMDRFTKINLIILTLGLCSLAVYLYQVYEIHQVNHWPKTDAEVTQSRITGYDYITQSRYGSRLHRHQEAIFEFKYEVAGRQYVSKCFCRVGDPPWNAGSDYPVGFHFNAFYNPVDPAEATVDAGVAGDIFLVISCMLFAVGFIGLKQSTSL